MSLALLLSVDSLDSLHFTSVSFDRSALSGKLKPSFNGYSSDPSRLSPSVCGVHVVAVFKGNRLTVSQKFCGILSECFNN